MISLDAVRQTCPTLGPDQVTSIFRLILKYSELPSDIQPLTTGEALLLWTADLISGLNLCSRDTLLVLLQHLHSVVSLHGNGLGLLATDEELLTQMPPLSFGIADRTYLTLENWKLGYFDLRSSTCTPALQSAPLETIVYNLSVLFKNQMQAAREIEAKDDTHGAETERAESQPADGSGESAQDG